MDLSVAYRGRSGLSSQAGGMSLSFAPNLRRDRVSFDGVLGNPLCFREAISALHDVVISNLKWKPKDRSAYQAYLERIKEREKAIRTEVASQTRTKLLAEAPSKPPLGLKDEFDRLRSRYWKARDRYAQFLSKNDPALFRALVPCDPVVTVAPDVLFFECFSKDESSYGCLTVERDFFTTSESVSLGTTNVDYSLDLFEQFQRLRTYRQTRFTIDPQGFEVTTQGTPLYREEKIDLPPSWLRGFMQLQGAMSLPMRKVAINREALYAILAHLKRHRARKSPRALRFELNPGAPVEIVLEPWELRLRLHEHPYEGAQAETIRVWGRDRLLSLVRLLPWIDGGEVYLLGTGLPTFWNLRLGGVRFLLGLSGWTANDWTQAVAGPCWISLHQSSQVKTC